MSASPWASAARSDPSPDGRRGRMLSSGHDLDLSCTATCPVQERFHESASPAQAAGSRQETLARRAAGRRQVRFHVHEPGRANARPAPGSGSRPVARTGARRADPWAGRRPRSTPRAPPTRSRTARSISPTTPMPSSPAPTSRSWSMRPARRPPASSTCWPAANTASTSSWSTSRPTRWPARCWRAARARPASSIRWPTATSPR